MTIHKIAIVTDPVTLHPQSRVIRSIMAQKKRVWKIDFFQPDGLTLPSGLESYDLLVVVGCGFNEDFVSALKVLEIPVLYISSFGGPLGMENFEPGIRVINSLSLNPVRFKLMLEDLLGI